MTEKEQKDLNWKLYKAVRKSNLPLAKELFQQGADINGRNEPWWTSNVTPLFEVLNSGSIDVLKWLLENGAETNITSGTAYRDTPLLWALQCSAGEKAIDLLLEHGADPRMKDSQGRSPISKVSGKIKHAALLEKFNRAVEKIEEKKRLEAEAALKARAEVKAKQEVAVVALSNEIVFNKKLGAVFLEETFNFAARERITLVRGTPDGPVQAVTRDSFAEIDEKTLQEAFNAYQKKGGKIPETEVFPDRIVKIRLPGAEKKQ